jgi:hypothetical protein
MSLLPRVSELTRERVHRQMDDLGPAACTEENLDRPRHENPELLQIARKCAADGSQHGGACEERPPSYLVDEAIGLGRAARRIAHAAVEVADEPGIRASRSTRSFSTAPAVAACAA